MFDSAPITKLKPNDVRTHRFVQLIEAWTAVLAEPRGGASAAERYISLRSMGKQTADAYRAGSEEANRHLVGLTNLVARHERATDLIAEWKRIWKLAKDPTETDAALKRLRGAVAASSEPKKGAAGLSDRAESPLMPAGAGAREEPWTVEFRGPVARPPASAPAVEDWVTKVAEGALASYRDLPDAVKSGLAAVMWKSWLAGPPERVGGLLMAAAGDDDDPKALHQALSTVITKLRALGKQLDSSGRHKVARQAIDTLVHGDSTPGYPVYAIHAFGLDSARLALVTDSGPWLQGKLTGVAGLELRALAGFVADVDWTEDGLLDWVDGLSPMSTVLDSMLPYGGWDDVVNKWIDELNEAAKSF